MSNKIIFSKEATPANVQEVIRALIRLGYAYFSPDGKTLYVTKGSKTLGILKSEEIDGINKMSGVMKVDR